MVNVYVTVGATVPFDELITQFFQNLHFLINNIVKLLKRDGKAINNSSSNNINIVVQYGKNYDERFKQLLNGYVADTKKKNIAAATTTDETIQSGIEVYDLLETSIQRKTIIIITIENIKTRIDIVGFPLSNNISNFLNVYMPDIFITHAGTGSLLDALKLKQISDKNKSIVKKRIVICVVNDKLMDNHQLDIALKFENLNLVECLHSSIELKKCFEQMDSTIVSYNSKGKDNDNFKNGFNKEFQNEILLGSW